MNLFAYLMIPANLHVLRRILVLFAMESCI